MRSLKIGLYALTGLITILIIGIAILFTLDLGRFKQNIEILVTDLLAREFRIDGPLHIDLGTSIEVYAEDAFLANPDWANSSAFLTVRKIDVSADLWSFISGPIVIERAEIDGIRVNIERNDDGQASWDFEGLSGSEGTVADSGPAPLRRLPVIADDVVISDSVVSFLSSSREEPLLFVAHSTNMDHLESDDIQLSLIGTLNDTPVNFESTSGPVQNLMSYRDVSVEFSGNVGEIEITGSSRIDDLLSPNRPQFSYQVKGPNAEYLTDILAMSTVTTGPLNLVASMQPDGESMAASVEGVFGEFTIDLDAAFSDLQDIHDVDLTVSAAGPSIGAVLGLMGREYVDLDAFQIDASIRRSGPRLTFDNVMVSIGASELSIDGEIKEFPKVNGASLSLRASGPDFGRFNRLLGMPGRLGGEFETNLNVHTEDSGHTVIDLDAGAPDVRIKAFARLSANEDFRDTTMLLDISGPDIAVLAQAAGVEGLPAASFEIGGTVEKDEHGYLLNNVKALIDDDVFAVGGHVGNDPLGEMTDLDIDFYGSDLGASIVALGGSVDGLPKGAYHLRGKIKGQEDRLLLQEINAAIGDQSEYRFEVSGFLTRQEQFVDSEVSVTAIGASLSALAELGGVSDMPDYPFDVSAQFRRGSLLTFVEHGAFEIGTVEGKFSGFFGDNPLEQDLSLTFDTSVPALKDVIAEFGISVEQLPQGDLLAAGTISSSGGRFAANNILASYNGATLRANGTIGMPPNIDGTQLHLSISGDDLSQLLPPDAATETLAHTFSMEGQFSLQKDELLVDNILANLGNTKLSGQIRVGLEPIASKGSFALQSSSPDLFELLPTARDVSGSQMAPMQFSGRGDWSDNYWNFEQFELSLAKGSLDIDGSLDGPPTFQRTDLNVALHVSSVSNFSVITQRDLPDHPLHLTAHVVGTQDVMTMENFILTFGDSDLSGQFKMQAGDVPTVNLDVESSLFDISEYLPKPEEPLEATEAAVTKPDRLLPDTPLPFDLLRTVNADVRLEIAEMRTRALRVRDVSLDAQLNNGALKVRHFGLTDRQDGHLNLSADLTPDEFGNATFSSSVSAEDLVLGLRADTEQELKALPTFGLQSELNGNGGSVSEIAGTLNGHLRVIGGEGRVKAGGLEFITQDFVAQVISTINPFSKTDPYTNVDCAAVLLVFSDGVVSGKPAVVHQTDKLRIFADVDIDLKTEKLDAHIQTIPQKGLGISVSNLVNPYVKLTGTLAKPALALDTQSVVVEGGVAVATAGLSILAKSFKNRYLSEKDPCGKAVAEADKFLEAQKK